MLWTVAKQAAANWSSHKDSRQGAALAYYSVFSLGPIIVIAIAVAGFFFGRDAVSGQVASSIKDMLGDTGAKAIQAMLVDAGRPREGLLATLLGLGALLFAAIGVVVQLKDALNTVWEVEEPPGQGVWHFMRIRRLPRGRARAWLPVIGFAPRNGRPCRLGESCGTARARMAITSPQHLCFLLGDSIAFRDDVQVAAGCGR
jgi:hypothetical protein